VEKPGGAARRRFLSAFSDRLEAELFTSKREVEGVEDDGWGEGFDGTP